MRQAPVIPAYAMQALALQCLASGMTPNSFGKQNGLTATQIRRLVPLVKERTELATRRTSAMGAIMSENQAKTIQTLSNRMISALVETGARMVEQLERLNRRYTPVTRRGKKVSRQIEGKDLPVYKFAWQTCERIVALSRKDGRDEPAIKPEDVPAMVQAVADRGPMQGTLTVVPASGGPEVTLSD